MNPILFITTVVAKKRYVVVPSIVLLSLVAMPVIGVFALGSQTLSLLSQSSSAEAAGLYEGPPLPSDTYDWGNCTYWVYLLRFQAHDPIPNTWGNAATWATNARKDGYVTDGMPTVGAIMQTANAAHGLGHVAYVTAVNPVSGAWTISEMNEKGLDIVDTRTLPAVDTLKYSFIHDKGQ